MQFEMKSLKIIISLIMHLWLSNNIYIQFFTKILLPLIFSNRKPQPRIIMLIFVTSINKKGNAIYSIKTISIFLGKIFYG